ncbi:MAG TPA: hypothetical protein VFP84_34125 [Kofleriaceae bacterium]|nr:hypothetical protein [Kofleriaceae bacterium]
MLRLFALSALALAACNAAQATPAATSSPADHDLCVAVMTHARACTDVYIPALVDARAAADIPRGIRAEVAKDRKGVIAQALREWATDSTDASIEALCRHPMPDSEADRATGRACQAKTDCAAFSQCVLPLQQKYWRP